MLSLPKGMSTPGVGLSYFQKDSYYHKGESFGTWYGKGAEKLQLSGSFSASDESYMRTLLGVDNAGNKLVKNAMDPERSSFLDCTFSAPKSVSILSYRDERIEAAHRIAVSKVLDAIESKYSTIRKGEGGYIREKTDNLVFARFDHHENRNLDPQLHSHCLLMNLSQGADGKWRTIENNALYTNKMYLGQLYRNELAQEVQKIGYSVTVTDREKGLFEIAGVDTAIIEEFSTRRKEILKNLKEYDNYKCSEAQKKEYACLDSRVNKQESSIENIRQETQERLQSYTTSLEEIVAKAHAEKTVITEQLSAHDLISKSLTDITENFSSFRREKVLQLAMKLGLGQYSNSELERAFNEHEEVIKLGEKNIVAGKSIACDVEVLSTKEMVGIEQGILNQAVSGIGKSAVSVSEEKAAAYVQAIEKSGVKFTTGQREAILKLSSSRDSICILQGDAGSGKSFAVEHIGAVMQGEGVAVRGFAPTGKAVTGLMEAKLSSTETIDMFLEKAKYDKLEVGRGELWVVDESSMMGSRKMARFLEQARIYDAKVILIGDTKQLQAVEAGKIFEDLQQYSGVSYCEMTEVRRQKTAEMREMVQLVKEKRIGEAFELLEKGSAIHEISKPADRLEGVTTEYLEDRRRGVESIVISGSNADRHRINDRIRELLVEKGDIMQGQTFRTFTSVGVSGSARSLADSYKEGQVLFLQEDVQGLKKGTQATITGVDAQRNELRVQYWNKEHGAYERDSIPVIYHGSKIRAFAIEEKNFSAGDEVLFLKNDKKIGVKNGQMGRIIAIDEEGTAKIRIGKEKRSALAGKVIDASVYVECNLSNTGARGYNFIDHGYAVTAHKSQGATVEKAIVYGDSTGMQTSTNDFYVCLTRAQYGVSVYTDSIERMRESASHEQRKESTLDTLSMDTFVEQTRRKYQEPTSLMLSEQAHKEKEQGEEIERRRRAAEILKESAKAIEEFEKRRPKSPEATHPEKSKEPEKVQKKPQPEKNKNSQGIELDL